jgi:hypothetical protein
VPMLSSAYAGQRWCFAAAQPDRHALRQQNLQAEYSDEVVTQ